MIVVDDASSDGTADLAERAGPLVKVLRQPGLGAAAARNRGAEHASGQVLVFTDADCFARPDWLRAGLAALDGADLVQGAVQPDPSVPRGPFDHTLSVVRETGLYESANIFVRREAFERVGGFEAFLKRKIGRPMGEDVWFGWRVRRAGGRTRFCAEAVVQHAVFPRRARDFIAERSRLRYFPDIARKVPELRRELFFARVFLSRRTAAFDLSLASIVAAIAIRSPLPLLGLVPYAYLLARQYLPWGRVGPPAAAVAVLADAVGLAALLSGDLRARTLIL